MHALHAGWGPCINPICPIPSRPQALNELRQRIKEPARESVKSPTRMYLYGGLTSVLVLAVVQDLVSGQPSYAIDALYAAVGASLAYTTVQERKAFSEASEQQDKRDTSQK